MSDATAELLIRQLYDTEERVRGIAAHRLMDSAEIVVREMPRFFELALPDDNIPSRCAAWHAINRTKSLGVPFLLGQTNSVDARCRERAIELLGTAGGWSGGSHLLRTQYLEQRPDSLPEWGEHAGTVLEALERSLSDSELSVRFAAALILESLNRSHRETIPIFIDALLNGNQWQKNHAALHLGRIGPLANPACAALAEVAGSFNENRDHWCDKMILAAHVALQRIGCGR